MRFTSLVVASAAVLLGASAAAAQQPAHDPAHHESDSAAAVAVLHRFHAALEKGDSATALSLLAAEVTILESGSIETRDQYRAHHLAADIAFARAVPSKRTVVNVRGAGGVVWVASTSITEGQNNGRAVNSAGAELVILEKVGADWKISAIHWSSRRRTGG